ncbi:MAG TPA: hypothetical protein PLA68_15955 [Panacibacter sp.]|nr:hypothetical protein [Panacibacter sp.]
MRKILLFTALFSGIGFSLCAQNNSIAKSTYKTAIGIRFFPAGITFKSNSDHKKSSTEVIAYFKDGFTGAFLHEWNFTLNTTRNLRAYIGAGGHVGFFDEASGGGAVLGADGAIGLDYKFLYLPVNISLDWQPSLQFGKNNDFRGWGGIGARLTL